MPRPLTVIGRVAVAAALAVLAGCSATAADSTLEDPPTVVVLGSSVADELVNPLAAALPTAEVRNETVYGLSDLSDPLLYDWRDEWPPLLDATDVFVVHGTFDPDTLPVCEPGCRRDAAAAGYQAVIADMMTLLGSQGASVVWIGHPPLVGGDDAGAAAIDAIAAEVAATHDVGFVDALDLLGGTFTPTLAERDSTWRQARKDDGVHLCPVAAALLVEEIVAAVDVPVAEDWRDGRWRRQSPFRVCDDRPQPAPGTLTGDG